METADYKRSMSDRFSNSVSSGRAMKYGAIAGLIATWSISTAIAASEFELGLPISTFYSIMGISLGSNDAIMAPYLGFGMHLATGTILGSVIGVLAVKIESIRKSSMANILDPYRAILMGIGTGMLVWLVLFLPVTAALVQPSEDRIAEVLSGSQQSDRGALGNSIGDVSQSFRGIALSAIMFHLMWGAMFGYIVSSLARIRLFATPAMPRASRAEQGITSGRSLKITVFGLAAGLISSLAISGLILLVERTSSLPVGTFYYVLSASITNSYSGNFEGAVGLGLAMHLLTGSFIGLIMSVPFMIFRNSTASAAGKAGAFIQKYAPIYGIVFGIGLWIAVFVPITYIIVVPYLNSFETRDVYIGQQVPTGQLSSTTFYQLLSMLDRLVFGAAAFNIFYGLLTAIVIKSGFEKYLVYRRQTRRTEFSA
jgi:hypothetical protein